MVTVGTIWNPPFFGPVIAYTYVIEFQKRGLPHMHLLLIVEDQDKPRTPEQIDAVISAEAPLETLSARVLASESVSLEEPTSNSSTRRTTFAGVGALRIFATPSTVASVHRACTWSRATTTTSTRTFVSKRPSKVWN